MKSNKELEIGVCKASFQSNKALNKIIFSSIVILLPHDAQQNHIPNNIVILFAKAPLPTYQHVYYSMRHNPLNPK